MNTQELYEPKAEQAVLASLLINSRHIEKIQEILPDATAFSNPFYQTVYQTILDLFSKNLVIDMITLTSYNKDIAWSALSDIINTLNEDFEIALISSINVLTHAGLVADAFTKRQLYEKMQRGENLISLMESVSKLQKAGETRFYTPDKLALQVLGIFEEDQQNTIQYPYRFLQAATNGIHKGQVVIVAGRPGAGKSTFIDNIAFHSARQRKKVLFASAEMSVQMIMMRIVSRMTGMNIFYKRGKQMNFEERARIDKATQEISEMGLHIQEFSAVAQLEGVLRDKAKDFDLIVVDYLQLLEPKGRWNSTTQKVSNVANELTHLAKMFNVPFVVAAQLSRAAEKQIPTMADLKESGQIEQNADVILTLYSQPIDSFTLDRQKVRVDMLKNRNGYGWVNSLDMPKHFLWFNKPMFEFSEPAPEGKGP